MRVFLIEQRKMDLNNIPDKNKNTIVSFDIELFHKRYSKFQYQFSFEGDFKIEENIVISGVGVLYCDSWSLKIDVRKNYFFTLLPYLSTLPSDELETLEEYNISPCALSKNARELWL